MVVYVGAALLMAIGAGVLARPAQVAARLVRDDDGNLVPVTPAVIRNARIAGIGLIVLGAVLMWYGPDAFQGPVDMGAP